ncbi:MAG: thiamine-phosphate kinase [Pseudomonadota bacterium]
MLTTLGEREVISRFFQPLVRFPGAHDLLDDCAELAPAPGQSFVFKTDPVRAGVHFFADDSACDIAWKALAVGVSDLAAKGARPVAYLLALAFPQEPDAVWLQDFASGLAEAQDAFGLTLIGGDTDRAAGPMSISPTVIGEVPTGRMIHRGGASPGDVLFVSGSLGEAAIGLGVRARELGQTIGPAPDGLGAELSESARARYLRPQPRLGMKAALRRYATASMDISDGLGLDIDRLITASSHFGPEPVGCEVNIAALPVAAAVQSLASDQGVHMQVAIGHGDDYEILATVKASDADDFTALSEAGGVPVTRIGKIEAAPGVRWRAGDGSYVSIGDVGYQHFPCS